MSDASRPRRPPLVILGFLFIALFAALPFIAPPDGHERAALAQFVGRFHPVLVHLPIGLLSLVPLLELLGLLHIWIHLQKSAGLILILATLGVLGATAVGWLLAWSGGYRGETVMNHLWGGIGLSVCCLLLLALRPSYIAGEGFVLARLLYIPLLLTTLGVMSWTSHQGSIITHGEDYLTKYMPGGLRSLFGIAPAPVPAAKSTAAGGVVAPASMFVTQVAPILDKHCVACHKPSKHKADLRMDTHELLMKGGESGPPVVAGSLEKSDLYRRITLRSDDEEFMPTDGKPALSPAEVKLVGEWITAGAKP
ncbi:MAG: hypothetical protein H7343_03940 [Undibacterium sp.]|nr:hypothetical protein [Opitutaceae bacterium]